MEIRTATVVDLLQVERLRLEALSGGETSAWRGVPGDVALDVRLAMWQSTAHLLNGLLVAVDGEHVFGTVAIAATGATLRFSVRHLPALSRLGLPRMARFVGVWMLTHYQPAPDEAFFYGMAVAPAYRRRAVARALTAAAEERARQWGKRVASLTVERTNAPSLELVRSMGYRFMEPPPRTGVRRLLMPAPTFVRAEKVLNGAG